MKRKGVLTKSEAARGSGEMELGNGPPIGKMEATGKVGKSCFRGTGGQTTAWRWLRRD